jgi:hypothetical protein
VLKGKSNNYPSQRRERIGGQEGWEGESRERIQFKISKNGDSGCHPSCGQYKRVERQAGGENF